MKTVVKRVIAMILAVLMMFSLAYSVLDYSMAINTAGNTLGSTEALGSAILNPNITSDEWNAHESLIWGIYLSNFCIPFVDTFDSAFNHVDYGSEGRGYNLIAASVGMSESNTSILKALTEDAIKNGTNFVVEPIASFEGSRITFVSEGSVVGSEFENQDYYYEYVFDVYGLMDMDVALLKLYKFSDDIKAYIFYTDPDRGPVSTTFPDDFVSSEITKRGEGRTPARPPDGRDAPRRGIMGAGRLLRANAPRPIVPSDMQSPAFYQRWPGEPRPFTPLEWCARTRG